MKCGNLERRLELHEDPRKVMNALPTIDIKFFRELLQLTPALRSEFPLLNDALISQINDWKEDQRMHDLSTIEEGSRIEYLVLASRNVPFIILVGSSLPHRRSVTGGDRY